MAETLRRPAGGAPADVLPHSISQPSLVRWLRAGAFGAFVFALLYAFLEARIGEALPAYPAVLLVSLVMFVLPGLAVCEALLVRTEGDAIERIVLAFAIGLALTAPAGLLALSLNLSLNGFIHLHVAVATVVAAMAGYLARPVAPSWPARSFRGWNAAAAGLLLFGGIAAIGILTSPAWASARTARNFDDWRYMTYVNSYLQEDEIDSLHPVGIGEAPYPRMAINVWVVAQAAIAHSADVDAEAVTIDDLTPLLAIVALGATYCLAKGLFRSRGIAALAVLIQLGIALTDLSRDEGLGHGLLLRVAEDKYVATYILLPLGLLSVTKFIARPRLDNFTTFALIGLAMFIVHPQPLLFLGVSAGGFAVLRAAVGRSWRPLGWAALLAVPLGAFMLGEYLCWHLFNTSWPAFFETKLTWRESFKIVHLSGGLIMGNFHLLLHPLTLAALVLAPFVWLRGRRSAPHQMLVAATLGWLPFFFFPPLTTVAAKLASAELTARLPQTAPIAVVCAYAVYGGLHWANKRWPLRQSAASIGAAPLRVVAPGALGAVVLLAGLVIQDLYYPVDGGAYFGWASRSTILPPISHSIFLGGKERLLSGEWRLKPEDREVFAYLDDHAARRSTVLMPEEMSLYFPGTVWNVKPAYSQGILGQWQRPAAQNLYRGSLQGADLQRALGEAGIDYVVVKEVSAAGQEMAALAAGQVIVELGPYQVYELQGS